MYNCAGMLVQLHIKHFAVIEAADLDFGAGLTVLTGETGAGKSVLMDALSLAVGGRADMSVIRAGENYAKVAAKFDVGALPAAQNWLSGHGFEADDECLLLRVLTKEGRSKAFINGTPATVRQLSDLGALLVNLHQQQSHLQLLGRARQLAILDDFGQHQEVCQEVSRLHEQLGICLARIEQASGDAGNSDRLELLSYQLSELEAIELEEYSKRGVAHKRLSGASNSRTLVAAAQNELSDQDASAANQLQHHSLALRQIADQDERLAAAVALIEAAGVHLSEAAAELNRYLDSVNEDPVQLAELETYLEQVHSLARKHKIAPEELIAHRSELAIQKATLEGAGLDLDSLRTEQAELETAYDSKAKQLSAMRANSALDMAHEITDLFVSLGMKGGSFQVVFQAQPETRLAGGIDTACFMVSGGGGQVLGPLDKVASGGELSRISIAIRLVVSGGSLPPTMVFDEADAGIGGQTATKVGELLKKMAAKTQVICATHLAQVAVFGDRHLYAEKGATGEGLSSLNVLQVKARRSEIARMLDGDATGEQGLAHADEMLNRVAGS